MNPTISAMTCDMRALSHEALARLAARNLHTLTVARDMLRGHGLEAHALEVIEETIGNCEVDAR
jgi:hypothetical protein